MHKLLRRVPSARLLRPAAAVASVLVFGAALWVIHRSVAELSLHDVARALGAMAGSDVALALLLSFGSYAALTGFDVLGLRFVGSPLPYRQVALASFMAQAIAHTAGFAALTATSIRFRLYSDAGVKAVDVARVAVFCAASFGLGAAAVIAGAALSQTHHVAEALRLPAVAVKVCGLLAAGVLAAYAALTLTHPRIRLGGWSLSLPGWRTTLGQAALAVLDLTLAAGALYVLMPSGAEGSFPAFLGLYTIAITAGVLSHVPGGVGVFEGIMLLFFPQLPTADLLGAVLVYRLVYNLLPLVLAVGLLGVYEVADRLTTLRAVLRRAGGLAERIAPSAFATLAMVGGLVLLASSATPAVPSRLHSLSALVPLPLMELSAMVASLVGVLLLLLARALFRRVDGAWVAGVGLASAGAVASLMKGWDYEEAALMAVIALLLASARRAFYRKASLRAQRFTTGWAAAVAVVVLGVLWLGWFSFKHAEYSTQMWWQFARDAEAPRALRATVLALLAAVVVMAARLLSPAPPVPRRPSPEELAEAGGLARASPSTEAQLVYLGDKHLLWAPERAAFLMYGRASKSLVAMGGPVGRSEAWPDLVWSFRELCDQHGRWPVFYQVRAEELPLYLELGLGLVKLGEEALVPLADFCLHGPARAELRYLHRRAARDGAFFELLPAGSASRIAAELQAVSEAWLKIKRTREKRFSLGRFDLAYLDRFPLALVRRQGTLVAFANVWLGGGRSEMAIDLMRQGPQAGYGTMDYLFIELMLWGKAKGYRSFSLGLAPLSGLRDNPLAPLWTRVGTFIFNNGEGLYNFQGLRRYKEKFAPQWRPRFMAAPGGLALPQVAVDVANLISGGVIGLVGK
jgi:phosphatidylglycerol lysyltransferase